MVKKKGKKRIAKEVLVAIFVFFSLLISIRSCCLSEDAKEISERANRLSSESNQIAKDALKTAEKFAISDQRPWVTIRPIKHKDTNSYLKYKNDDGKINVKWKYELINIGKAPAQDISIFKHDVIRTRKQITIKFTVPPDITLIKGVTYIGEVNLEMGMKKDSAKKYTQELDSGEKGISIQIGFSYHSMIDPSEEFSTKIYYKIYKEKVVQIKKTEIG